MGAPTVMTGAASLVAAVAQPWRVAFGTIVQLTEWTQACAMHPLTRSDGGIAFAIRCVRGVLSVS